MFFLKDEKNLLRAFIDSLDRSFKIDRRKKLVTFLSNLLVKLKKEKSI